MGRIREAEKELIAVFRSSATKHEANERAKPIMEQLSRDPGFLTAVLQHYVATPGVLDKRNYPVVTMNLALNPWFGIDANCWIPLPDGNTNLSTKAIHHHGDLLLTTATLFGPGYEHWQFTMPKLTPGSADVYTMDVIESAPHPRHHVSFVDKWTPHVPFYPNKLSITLALWSNSRPTTWRDHVKRIPIIKGRTKQLRQIALKLGLKKRLDLKVVESFDYFPVEQGFNVINKRTEFALGPNMDNLCCFFQVLQETGNEHLARDVRRAIDDRKVTIGRPNVEELVKKLERGTPIQGRLSEHHHDIPEMNFTREAIYEALDALKKQSDARKGDDHGRKFAASAIG
jgi:hypothetical protein